jgi:hypothetical protein
MSVRGKRESVRLLRRIIQDNRAPVGSRSRLRGGLQARTETVAAAQNYLIMLKTAGDGRPADPRLQSITAELRKVATDRISASARLTACRRLLIIEGFLASSELGIDPIDTAIREILTPKPEPKVVESNPMSFEEELKAVLGGNE